ncbi:MAG: hypothetical protein ACTHN5_16980 [Phycisphaerae bacterium]
MQECNNALGIKSVIAQAKPFPPIDDLNFHRAQATANTATNGATRSSKIDADTGCLNADEDANIVTVRPSAADLVPDPSFSDLSEIFPHPSNGYFDTHSHPFQFVGLHNCNPVQRSNARTMPLC